MTEIDDSEGALHSPEAVLAEMTPPAHPPRHRVQYAALPYRIQKDGQIEVLLITSRTSKRWIIPKGWPMGTLAPHKVAAQEAFEEAGVIGRAAKVALGVYHYEKLLSSGLRAPCRVEVFALKLGKEKSIWPERKQRKRCWLSLEEAANRISDAELAPILRAFVPR